MNSTTETGRDEKSSSELKAEVDATINRLDQGLSELKSKMTPGRVIDEAILRGREDSLKGTIDHLRNNPIGTTFLGLGTLLLMGDQSHVTGEDRLRYFAQQSAAIAQDAVDSAKETLSDLKEETREEFASVPSGEFRPLAIAALGLGLGTVLGSSLPVDPNAPALADASDVRAMANEVQAAMKESSRRFLGLLADELTQKTFH